MGADHTPDGVTGSPSFITDAYAVLAGAAVPCVGSAYIIFAAMRSRPAGAEV